MLTCKEVQRKSSRNSKPDSFTWRRKNRFVNSSIEDLVVESQAEVLCVLPEHLPHGRLVVLVVDDASQQLVR